MFEQEKIPHSLTIEQTLIYGMSESLDIYELIKSKLTKDDFYSSHHRVLFDVITKLRNKKIEIDFMFVAQFATDNNLLDDVGGVDYLEFIVRNSIITENIKVYIDVVFNHSLERKVLSVLNKTKEKILIKDGTSTEEIFSELENSILTISQQKNKSDSLNAYATKELVDDFIQGLKESLNREDGELSGIDTGISMLNDFTDGLQKQDLIYVGARPSMGKTSFGMNLVESALFSQELPVVVFSMESPKRQIIQRFVSSISGVSLQKIVRANYEQGESDSITTAIRKIKDRKLIICDKGGLSPSDMRTVLRQVMREHGGIGMIMADYVQKMELKGFDKNNKNAELTIISSDLKEIAKDFNCPFVCLAQLSKECERRPNKRPMMSDLRDCGGLEQDADMIIMLYRDEVYYQENTENKGLAELIIVKNRNGQTGVVPTRFNGACFRFSGFEDTHGAF